VADLSPEKRILLAFALSFLVLAAWSGYLRQKEPPPETPAEQAQPAEPKAAPEVTPPPAPTPATQAEAPAETPSVPTEARQGSVERLITVETETSTIVFSTHGASVRSWRLKDYKDDKGEPVELVEGRLTGQGYPLTFSLGDPKREEALNDALYVASPETDTLTAPVEVVFEWSDGHLAARKSFRFDRSYFVQVETEVVEDGKMISHRLAWRGGFGERPDEPSGRAMAGNQVFVRGPAKLLKQPAGMAGQPVGWVWKSPSPFPFTGEASYAGIDDRYFAAVFLPHKPQLSATAWTQNWKPEGAKKALSVGQIAVGVPNSNRLELFVGPKDLNVLRQVQAAPLPGGLQPDLADDLVDFGWFWWVAKPLFSLMKWMYRNWVPNYGWVIVLLTVAINVILFPLRWKSMQSSFKMQKVAPQVKAIQERYKQYKFNDPRKQQMQQEIMALYREHGVNPMGGCLPLVVQLPFFYGFYKVLALTIEMRHAPWVLWITDLSQKDPYYILPIGMAVTMYLSTSLTPMTTADPRQKRMMQVMMLVFAFLFLQVSAGLVLYWFSSSLVGLVQQLWINRWQHQHEEAQKEAARAEKKMRKKRKRASEGGES
jgi:YidC/Oxa1 family membrane protein insertase